MYQSFVYRILGTVLNWGYLPKILYKNVINWDYLLFLAVGVDHTIAV